MKHSAWLLCTFAIMSSCQILNYGQVGVAERKKIPDGKIVIGFIENRDSHYNPFATKNFVDMLAFELTDRGYEISRAEMPPAEPPKPPQLPGETKDKNDSGNKPDPNFKKAEIDTAVLPAILQDVAGEKKAERPKDEDRLLREGEIKILLEHEKGSFFVQGAISHDQNGVLLDVEENSLAFLELFDKNGSRVGMFTFTVKGRTFSESSFLKNVCSRMVNAIVKSLSRGKR